MSLFGCYLLPNHKQPPSTRGQARCAGRALRSSLWAITAAIVGFSATARGYVLEGQSWPTGTVVVLQLSLGSPGGTLQDGNTSWNAAAAPVSGMWNARLQRMQFSYVMNSGATPSSGDNLNTVAFSSSVFGQPFGGNTLAVTYYRYSGSTMHEADVLLNQAQHFDSYRGPLQFPPHGFAIPDIRRVLLHELGHGIGLDHPDTAGQHVVAVMNSIVSDQEVLSADDIAGGQSIYGVPAVTTPTPTPGPGVPSHLANISTRMKVGVGEDVLIGGFIIQGTEAKKLILRAIGPSLSGIPNVLPDPVLELHSASGAVMASNDDWPSSDQASEISESGMAPNSPYESAIIATLSPGSYTAVVKGYDNAQGVGLVEAYELDGNSTRLVNISTRGQVGVSDEAMIGGLIVQGSNAKRVIVRALGPSIALVGGGALADPVLELHNSSGALLASNDNWINNPQYSEIIASTVPPPNTMESAIIATCGAGNYTAIVRGAGNTTGVALVEVYDLDH